MGALFLLLSGLLPAAHGAVASLAPGELCRLANRVVIATVVERSTERGDGGFLLTTSLLRVERVIAGTPRGEVRVQTLGGELDGVVQHVGEEPAMRVGERYRLLLHQPSAAAPAALIGGTLGARRMDPTAELPPQAELQEAWESACDEFFSPT